MLTPGTILDGYCLIHPIGRGGFGVVWLCQVEATGEYRALKYLPSSDLARLERELAALIRYRTEATRIQSPNLLPIEHVNRTDDGLFYSMPLADGLDVCAPCSSEWRPKILAALIRGRRNAASWFSAHEIQETLIPLAKAAQALSEAGVAHRDIKPENILFVEGRPCLGDISLLTDGGNVTIQSGTPGYISPRWYLESGGNPDQWGLAVTLYSMTTGNPPDKLGRASFLWPPQGEKSVERRIWNKFHRIIFRGTAEDPVNRFPDLNAFADALADATVKKPLMVAGVRIVTAFRDAVITNVLANGATFIAGIAGAPLRSKRAYLLIALANVIFGIIGFTFAGCMTRKSRWRHLLVVAFMMWFLSLLNLYFLFDPLAWFFSFPWLLILMAIGGGISCFLTKTREIFRKLTTESIGKVEKSPHNSTHV